MKTLALILAIVLTIACGSPQHVNPELKSYVNEILDACAYDDCKLSAYIESIEFGKPKGKPENIGYCEVEPAHPDYPKLPLVKRIVIDKVKWDALTENKKTALMAHELGHCNWWQEHDNSHENLMHASRHMYANPEDPIKTFLDYYIEHIEK